MDITMVLDPTTGQTAFRNVVAFMTPAAPPARLLDAAPTNCPGLEISIARLGPDSVGLVVEYDDITIIVLPLTPYQLAELGSAALDVVAGESAWKGTPECPQ